MTRIVTQRKQWLRPGVITDQTELMSGHHARMARVLGSSTRSNRPIIAVVPGSGLIARCAMEGEVDLLMVLSAGFFRNLGAGSLASFMPYANTNQITERLLTEQILPSRGNVPVIAGVSCGDPARPRAEILQHYRSLGVEGITNWPAVGFVDGSFREALEAEGFGIEAEAELLMAARQAGLAAFGFALEPAAARRFAEAEADALILDLGLTQKLEDVREHGDQLQRAIVRLQEMLEAVNQTGRRPLLLCFGGPVTTQEDLEQVFRQCDIDGFAGGSVFERLPVHEIVTATVRRFKSIGMHAKTKPSENLGELIGRSPSMNEIFRLIRQVAAYDVNVCIEGETGTGKELVATLLHRYSARTHGPFITLNCGAIPEPLLESELFGHEKGAFTGAHRQRIGKFELAHRGTLFLDEIADLSPHGQVALLRAIQQREITRVGGEMTIPADVRIITASHQSLPQLVQAGKFRADLFYRLNHIALHLPPLRDRREDIPLLSEAILARLQVELNRKTTGLSVPFFEKLKRHAWPGNVRELEHVLRQAAILEDGLVLTGRFFTPNDRGPAAATTVSALPDFSTVSKQLHLSAAMGALSESRGNKTQAAAVLGISRKTLYSWLGNGSSPEADQPRRETILADELRQPLV